jgi:hypothetical protein
VIGVLPASFRLTFPGNASVPPNVEVFESVPVGPWQPDGPGFLHVIGRMRKGATHAAAKSKMNSAAAQINKFGGRAHRSTLPGYFTSIGAALLEGRDFSDNDNALHQHVAIIDDVLARQLWPGESPACYLQFTSKSVSTSQHLRIDRDAAPGASC